MTTWHYQHKHTVTLTPTQRTALLNFLQDVWPGQPADVVQVSFARDQQNPSSINAGMVGTMQTTDVGDLSAGMLITQIDE